MGVRYLLPTYLFIVNYIPQSFYPVQVLWSFLSLLCPFVACTCWQNQSVKSNCFPSPPLNMAPGGTHLQAYWFHIKFLSKYLKCVLNAAQNHVYFPCPFIFHLTERTGSCLLSLNFLYLLPQPHLQLMTLLPYFSEKKCKQPEENFHR